MCARRGSSARTEPKLSDYGWRPDSESPAADARYGGAISFSSLHNLPSEDQMNACQVGNDRITQCGQVGSVCQVLHSVNRLPNSRPRCFLYDCLKSSTSEPSQRTGA